MCFGKNESLFVRKKNKACSTFFDQIPTTHEIIDPMFMKVYIIKYKRASIYKHINQEIKQ